MGTQFPATAFLTYGTFITLVRDKLTIKRLTDVLPRIDNQKLVCA